MPLDAQPSPREPRVQQAHVAGALGASAELPARFRILTQRARVGHENDTARAVGQPAHVPLEENARLDVSLSPDRAKRLAAGVAFPELGGGALRHAKHVAHANVEHARRRIGLERAAALATGPRRLQLVIDRERQRVRIPRASCGTGVPVSD